MKKIILNINSKKFPQIFQKYVAQSISYLFDHRFEDNVICGYIHHNDFKIWQNIGIRNFKMLTYGVLHGTIQEDGSLVYYFRKRMDGVIFLIAMAVFNMIMGGLCCYHIGNIMFMLPFILIAFFMTFLACWHSKKDQKQLISTLNCIIYDASDS